MAHRSARGALRERREEILERLAILEVKDDADEERAALLKELDEVRGSLELITPPRSVLKRLRIVRGCDVPWDSMVGSARLRHCGACDREVYDLTALDPDEVEAFVEARKENLPCIRMYARPDGRYQDGPCEPAKRRLLKRAMAVATALGLTGLLGALSGEANAEQMHVSSESSSTFDGRGFTSVTSEPFIRESTIRGRGLLSHATGGPMEIAPTRPYADELERFESRFWSHPAVLGAAAGAPRGYVTLSVTVDTRGRVSAEVDHTSEGLDEIAARIATAASGTRAPFRPTEPVSTHWYRAFR